MGSEGEEPRNFEALKWEWLRVRVASSSPGTFHSPGEHAVAQGWLRGALSWAGGGPKEGHQALPGLRSLILSWRTLPSSESKGRGLGP